MIFLDKDVISFINNTLKIILQTQFKSENLDNYLFGNLVTVLKTQLKIKQTHYFFNFWFHRADHH